MASNNERVDLTKVDIQDVRRIDDFDSVAQSMSDWAGSRGLAASLATGHAMNYLAAAGHLELGGSSVVAVNVLRMHRHFVAYEAVACENRYGGGGPGKGKGKGRRLAAAQWQPVTAAPRITHGGAPSAPTLAPVGVVPAGGMTQALAQSIQPNPAAQVVLHPASHGPVHNWPQWPATGGFAMPPPIPPPPVTPPVFGGGGRGGGGRGGPPGRGGGRGSQHGRAGWGGGVPQHGGVDYTSEMVGVAVHHHGGLVEMAAHPVPVRMEVAVRQGQQMAVGEQVRSLVEGVNLAVEDGPATTRRVPHQTLGVLPTALVLEGGMARDCPTLRYQRLAHR